MKKSIVASVVIVLVLISNSIGFPEYALPSRSSGSIVGLFLARETAGESQSIVAPEYFPHSFIIGSDTTLYAQLGVVECSAGLDPNFDGDGRVRTDIQGDFDNARAVAIQADGKIVVAGSAFNGTNIDFAVLRYNPNGTLDTSFDGDGRAITPVGSLDDFAQAVAIQSDGKIVVAGFAGIGGTDDFAVVRYNTDGTPDNTFDTDGKATFDLSATFSDVATGVVVQPDGKIVVAGYSFNGTNNDISVIRLTDTGLLDPTFNGTGVTTFGNGGDDEVANAVALMTDGKIVVAGYTEPGNNKDFSVARILPNGTLDPSFDFDGRVASEVRVGDDIATSVAIQADGKIVAAGSARSSGSDVDFAAVRYNADGQLDNTFDTDGRFTVRVKEPNNFAKSIVIQPDSKIVIAGDTSDGTISDFGIVRLLADGSFDPSFDNDGIVTIDFETSLDTAFGMALQADGKFVVAGDSDVGVVHEIGLVRLGGPCVPEMDVKGNLISIADGDTTPAVLDHTDFGQAGTVGGSVINTFTIFNTGTADLTLSNPTISGRTLRILRLRKSRRRRSPFRRVRRHFR